MDFEKAYKALVAKLKNAYLYAQTDSTKAVLEDCIPELAESEDERIRKELIDHCLQGSKQRTIVSHKEDYKRWLAWLEKRKEQKSELPLMNGDADLYFDEWRQQYQGSPTKRECFEEGIEYAQRVQKEQKPAEWSEEDEDMYARIVHRYTDYEGVIMRTKEESVAAKMLDAMAQEENWLNKSLHPSWKPSEEQMSALKSTMYDYKDVAWYNQLSSLYNDLKKL